MYELIVNSGQIEIPAVQEAVEWTTERKGVPGKLVFTVVADAALTFTEGNPVRFKANGQDVFYGFVFQKKRSKSGLITVTAYDQLRYLKNKDTYVYENKTATQIVQMLADDFALQTGGMEDTGYVIDKRIEDNQTLFDIIQNALDLTLQHTKKLYVLYDDFGKIALKNVENMKLNLLLSDDTAQDYDYLTSIDGDTYNKIKLSYENEETGKRDIYIAQDSANMNEWGILQYFETINEGVDGAAKADALLSLYNQKTRNLRVSGAFGDSRVRAGSSVPVILELDDISVRNYMMVEKVKHSYSESMHFMDLTLRGGEFV